MSRTVKRALSVILALAMLLGSLCGLDRLLRRKGSQRYYQPFFQVSGQVDVLFFGSSHVFDGILPMELWEDYGISSYVLAVSAATLPVDYWMAVNALDYCQPKVIVLDLYRLSHEEHNSGYPYVATAFDHFPMSVNKVKAIRDLAAHGMSREERLSLCWPFYNYHSRWPELSQEDFVLVLDSGKGGRYLSNSVPGTEPEQAEAAMELAEDLPGPEYVRKLAGLCEERGIELLLAFLPFPADEEAASEALAAGKMAEELGAEYINFLDLDLVDYQTDMYDGFSHLNNCGAIKVTGYIGQTLAEDYGLEDHRPDPAYAQWHEDLAKYKQEKADLLATSNYGVEILTLLGDDVFSAAIRLEAGSPMYGDEHLMALLENAAGQELPGLEAAALAGEAYGLILDREEGLVRELPANELDELQMEGIPQLPEGDTVMAAWPTLSPEKAIARSFLMEDGQLVCQT